MKRNNFEKYKKIYTFFVDFLLLVCASINFAYIWDKKLNVLLHVNFQNKGNWLMILVFACIFWVFMINLQGFRIGYFTISSLFISQIIANICTGFVVAIQIILMSGQVYMIKYTIVAMAELTLLNIFVVCLITYVFTKIYNKLLPPYQMLHIYGNHTNFLKEKIAFREDKYSIVEDIHIDTSLENIERKILEYDAVILNDIPTDLKNKILKFCFEKGIRVYFVPKISDILIKGSEEINLFDTPLFLSRNSGISVLERIIKRILDIVISFLGIIISSPIMLLTAICIKIEDRGPVFYNQIRCTRNGKQFYVHKFRSMRVDAEKKGGAQLAKRNDDRITKVGRFIRKTRIDELPQFLNVLVGEMSFVGPRPERPEFVEKNCESIPEFRYRMKVKAGLTGYAQVYGKYSTDFLDKLKLDLLYIEKYSILLDLQIILMTIKTIFMKESAEGLDTKEKER